MGTPDRFLLKSISVSGSQVKFCKIAASNTNKLLFENVSAAQTLFPVKINLQNIVFVMITESLDPTIHRDINILADACTE